MIRKERLDNLLAERGLCPTPEQAQRCILAGEVWQGTTRLEKPGVRLPWDAALELRPRAPRYVSRAGLKLEHGLAVYGLQVEGKVCLDIGSSTGGFTDCLIQKGARRVFSVDVGHGILDSKLRNHPRVTVLEKTNARHLTAGQLQEAHADAADIAFVCADVSFISLAQVVPAVAHSAPSARDWLLLFKPQFEVSASEVEQGGIVTNQAAIDAALSRFDFFMEQAHFRHSSSRELSPVAGKRSGNTEILLHYAKV